MRHVLFGLWLGLVSGLALGGCTELPPISEQQCGNGILEPQEDCDNTTALCNRCGIVCSDDDCPAGFRCGADDFCHAPSGAFAATSPVSAPFPVIGFRIADVDFDGYGDVVGLNPTAINVRYGSEDAALSRSVDVVTPQVQGLPALTSLDPATGNADVILPTVDGLVAYTGAFGVPTPRQFPLGGDQGPENLGGRPDPFDAVKVDNTVGAFGAQAGADPDLAFRILVVTAQGPRYDAETTNLCGTVAPAVAQSWPADRVIQYQTPAATFIAFTYTNTCVLRVRRAAQPIARGQPSCPVEPGVPLVDPLPCIYEVESLTGPAFPTLSALPVFADLDGDGCPSLISQDRGLGELVEYTGTSNGLGGCTVSVPAPMTYLPAIPDPIGSQLLGAVPLVPPVSGLAAEALITTYAIHGLETSGTTTRPLYYSDRPVRKAEIGDIGNDGAIDVILTSAVPNLDIARRVPTQDAFLLVRTPTTGAVEVATVGDYDGDQRDDIAYVENLGPRQRLSVAYGSPVGVGPGVPADAFDEVRFMTPMQVVDSTDPFGLVDDLLVIDLPLSPTGRSIQITLLHGSPSRTMLSFYGPPLPIPGTAFRGAAAGDFLDRQVPGIDSSLYPDLVAFQTGVEGGTAMWIVPGLPGPRLGEPQFGVDRAPPTTTLVDSCLQSSAPRFCIDAAKFVAWPTVISDDPAVSRSIVLGVDYRPDGAAPRVLRLDPLVPSSLTIVDDVFPAGGAILQLEAIDVDHDGTPELVAAFAESVPGRGDGQTLICSAEPDGTIRVPCIDVAADVLSDAELECVDAIQGRVAPVCRGGDAPDPRLVVLCRKGGQSAVIPISGRDGIFIAERSLLEAPVQLEQIQLGDVDGDRVQDLVALDVSSGLEQLEVFRQLTTREADTCSAE